MSEAKGGMSFEEAKQRRGKKMVYLKAPWLNVIVADKYKDDTSYAWVELAKFFVTLTGQPKATKVAIIHEGTMYYWMSYNLIISRLWHYGIRSKSTVSRALYLLCNPSNNQPPILKRIEKRDRNGHLRLYYTGTDALDDLFSTDPEWADHSEDAYESSDEDDVFDDEESPSGEVSQPSDKPIELFTFPDWWSHFWEEVSATGKYKDKIYKDKEPTVVNGYVQDTVETIDSILNNTYYNKGSYGEHHDVKYDLSNVTIDSIIDALKKYNTQEPVTMKEVICPFPGRGKQSKKSRFISLLCVGTEWPKDNTPVKLSKNPRIQPDKYRPELKDPTPSFVWAEGYSSAQNTPDRHYPEFSIDSPMFWGLYREVQEYHEACTVPDGIWLHNNTSGKPPVSVLKIVMAMLEAAKDAGISYDELIREVKVGVDKNWIWALTIQKVFTAQNSYKIGRGVTGDLYKHLYNAWPLVKEYYKE